MLREAQMTTSIDDLRGTLECDVRYLRHPLVAHPFVTVQFVVLKHFLVRRQNTAT